jgi:eukaryotic-like serine/threonine-protein kinase
VIGKTVSHYDTLEKLGGGGMGVVYKAKDLKLDRFVAMKFLSDALLRDRHSRERFHREARTIAALDHPNICTIYDFGEHDGRPFIVMQLLKGETLRDRITGKPFKIGEVIAYGVQIAEGLKKAHTEGIIHRDIKPANIFITTEQQAKLLDFGLAKPVLVGDRQLSELPTLDTGNLTGSGEILGTIAYMSPEQARGEELDTRTDVFSYGAVLYEMATGRQAFPGVTSAMVFDGIMHRNPPRPGHVREDINANLEEIKALEKERNLRYPTATELLLELKRLQCHREEETQPKRRGIRGGSTGRRLRQSHDHVVAVLPLKNLSADPEQEFFADGMTDALITNLAKIGQLRVISRTSVMRFKGVNTSLSEIARQLGADTILEGTIWRFGDRVRINAQLVDAPSETHIWAENYDRNLWDVLALQDDLGRAIAHQVQLKLTPAEHQRLASRRRIDPAANDAYLRGRYHWNKRTADGFRKAIEYFKEAIEIDPTYAFAYAGVANCYDLMGHQLYGFADPRDTYPKARSAAMKALELDENLAEAHCVLADVLFRYDRDFSASESEHRRALELNPSYSTGHQWYSHLLLPHGRKEESLAESKLAMELDPLSLAINMHLGWHHTYAREFDQALRHLKKTLDLGRDFTMTHLFLGQALEAVGCLEEAISELSTAVALSNRSPVNLGVLGHAYAVSGNTAAAHGVLNELREMALRHHVPSYEFAIVCAGLGENEQAIAWLERACEQRDSSWLVDAGIDPRLDCLHAEIRFQNVLKQLRLPQALVS